jgi:hypothetical protein
LSSKKDEREKFAIWTGIKITVGSKTIPPQKWRVDPPRINVASILLFRHLEGQTTTVKISQPSLSIQLATLAEHWCLNSQEKVLAIESSLNEFLICGIFLPLYLGSDLFILPPQLAKQESGSTEFEKQKLF